MKSRKLTVEPFGNAYQPPLPWRQNPTASTLRLKGQWLAKAGFEPGMPVAVALVARGVLEIRAITESETPEQKQDRLAIMARLNDAIHQRSAANFAAIKREVAQTVSYLETQI